MKYATPLCHSPRKGAWRSAIQGEGAEAELIEARIVICVLWQRENPEVHASFHYTDND
jgi:hypothetical protein